MQKTFEQLSAALPSFLQQVDNQTLAESSQGSNQSEHNGGEVANQARHVDTFRRMQAQKHHRSAKMKGLAVFGTSVGKVRQWFRSCPCHAHILESDLSEREKKEAMAKELGNGSTRCWRQGKRGSELARGAVPRSAADVANADSPELQSRLSILASEVRSQVVVRLYLMRKGWAQEFKWKRYYYVKLPWLVMGFWPVDSETQAVCVFLLVNSMRHATSGLCSVSRIGS